MATTQNSQITRVALLLGGDSSEREVSFKTAMAMARALAPERFQVTAFDISSHDLSNATNADALPSARVDAGLVSPHEYSSLQEWWSQDANARKCIGWNALAGKINGAHDVVLSALHGGWGEDGTVQALLEVAGVPYVGSPQRASVIAMDKQMCKAVMREAGIQSPRGALLSDEDALPPFKSACVVKPNGGGSSVGVSILQGGFSSEAWRVALKSALSDGGAALVEEMVSGVEVTVAVLGERESARVLPVVEIVAQSEGGFYDYAAKYGEGGSKHLIPPRVSQQAQESVAACALRAHNALGCRGVSRSDYIVTPDGTPYFLEINTLPGMTATSLVPDAARAAGMSFESLIETLVQDALNRHDALASTS